jgi:hypothetical protein
MSTADRPGSAPAPSDVAAELRGATLVRLVATPDGDALAAAGLLGRALTGANVAFQARVRRGADLGATEADVTVCLGQGCGDVTLAGPTPASATAFAVARELGTEPDPVLALAGVVAAGAVPCGDSAGILEAAEERSLVERRPGVAIPTADLADGLAHSTLVHAAFSGDVDAATAALADLDLPESPGPEDHRRLASLVALSVVEDAPASAAEAVERALRPCATAEPFATVGGYADVLEAVAQERPGTGLALALGHGGCEAALGAWREHATAAHRALRSAEVARHRGCVVAKVGDAPLATVARLLRDYRSPEPVAVAVSDDEAAVATTDRDAATLVGEAARAAGGTGVGRATRGSADITDADAFVTAVREALA